jgi:hypothetical protein
MRLPNTACTRLVGVCAFSGILCGLRLVLSKWRCLIPPTSRVTHTVGQPSSWKDQMIDKQPSSSSEKTKYPYGYGLSRITLLKLYMNKASVGKWSLVLGLTPFVVIYPWILFREHIFSNPTFIFLDRFVFAFGFFVWGFVGLFWAYRRRVPQAVMVKGTPAYLMGLFMLIVGWLLSIDLFVQGLELLLDIL